MLQAITAIGSQTLIALLPMQFLQLPEDAGWNVSGDHFRCAMDQSLPGVGEISFVALPSGETRLILNMEQSRVALLSANVSVKSSMSEGSITAGHERLPADSLSNYQAEFRNAVGYMLTHLQNGNGLRFQLRGENEDIVFDSGVSKNAGATRAFRTCMQGMSNLAEQQRSEFSLEYARGQKAVNQHQMTFLSDLAHFILLDRNVRKVLIDGYTDDVGTATANLLLSRERAEIVSALLAEKGVSQDMMEVRAHGDRYPLISNEGSINNNRRVEIRLVRPIL